MYSLAKILYFNYVKGSGYFPKSDSSHNSEWKGYLNSRYEVVGNFTQIEPAMKQRELLKGTLSTSASSAWEQAVDYVVFNTEAQLYDVKAVANYTQSQQGSGYFGIWANSVPFEVAKSFCDFFNTRHPINTQELYSAGAPVLPIALVMFPAGSYNNISYETVKPS